MDSYAKQIEEASDYLKSKIITKPKIGLVLGSGLGVMVEELQEKQTFSFEEIPHMKSSTVEGHQGQIVIGKLQGQDVIVLHGRLHYYEGYSMQEITFPIRLFKKLGVSHLIVTSACGGLSEHLHAGSLMIIEDHLNLMGTNPLIGQNLDDFGPRFPDMSDAYNAEFRSFAMEVGKKESIDLQTGIHAAITGPYYFSNAELRMAKIVGGDSIGMSMVPEIVTAVHSNIKCLGIACITDMAIPDSDIEKLTHEKVLEQAQKARPTFIKYMNALVQNIDSIL